MFRLLHNGQIIHNVAQKFDLVAVNTLSPLPPCVCACVCRISGHTSACINFAWQLPVPAPAPAAPLTVAAVAHFAEQINYACSAMETGLGKRKSQHSTLAEPRRKACKARAHTEIQRERQRERGNWESGIRAL